MEIQFYPKKCFVVLNSPKTVKCNRLIYHALTFFPKGRLSFVKKKKSVDGKNAIVLKCSYIV